jgi:pyruvate/2-oxoglutarate dehydrogenase complex dihydrolipoamide dehydrogenase (E3) component
MALAVAVTSPKPPEADTLNQEDHLRRVRPANWQNPEPKPRYDLAIIGGGPAGLVAARTAIRLGLSVALIERYRLGGGSLDTGSIPSKTIIRTASVYATTHRAQEFGAPVSIELPADFLKITTRMRGIRARIAEYHSASDCAR